MSFPCKQNMCLILKKLLICSVLTLFCAGCSFVYGSKKAKKGVVPGAPPPHGGVDGPIIPGCIQERDLDNITDLAGGPVYLRTFDRLQSIPPVLLILSNRLDASQRLTAQACQASYIAQTLRPGECGRVFQVIYDQIAGIGSPVCEPEPSPPPSSGDSDIPDGDVSPVTPGGDSTTPVGGGVSPPVAAVSPQLAAEYQHQVAAVWPPAATAAAQLMAETVAPQLVAAVSPPVAAVSPQVVAVSAQVAAVSPQVETAVSPGGGSISPGSGSITPGGGSITPGGSSITPVAAVSAAVAAASQVAETAAPQLVAETAALAQVVETVASQVVETAASQVVAETAAVQSMVVM